MQVNEAKDQVILTTFQGGLLPGDFFFSITKSPPKTVAELLRKAQKYMNTEDAMLTKEMKGKTKRDEGTNKNWDKKKETRSGRQTIGKKKKLPDRKPKFTNFTPLIMPIEQVLIQIRDDPSLQWQKPISTPVERRDKIKYCRFHQDHEHRIDECRHLKDQMETLIRQGKFQKYIKKAKPYRYQQKDDQDRTPKVRDSKPPTREIKTISG